MRGILFAALLAAPFTMEITAYHAGCRGCSGVGANGMRPVLGVSIACPPQLELGTWLEIEGLGERRCDDRGARITGRRLDLFLDSHRSAVEWGRRTRRVEVL